MISDQIKGYTIFTARSISPSSSKSINKKQQQISKSGMEKYFLALIFWLTTTVLIKFLDIELKASFQTTLKMTDSYSKTLGFFLY